MNIVDEILKRAELVDKIHNRARVCLGMQKCGFVRNVKYRLPFDRLFKGVLAEADYWEATVIERAEMQDALNIAAVSMANMHDEIQDLKQIIKASGIASMMLGEKRDPSKEAELDEGNRQPE